jgi:hypothetical protein
MKRAAKALAAALLCLALPGLAAEGVTQAEGSQNGTPCYLIDGNFEVTAKRSEVWAVLSDYGALKGVVSSMLDSRVKSREGSVVLVEQTMRGRFLFFRRTLKLLLKVEEAAPQSMDFAQVTGKPFRIYEGGWRLSDTPQGVKVDYRLVVSSADMAPAFVERGLFRDNARDLLNELKAEILRRMALRAGAQNKIPS